MADIEKIKNEIRRCLEWDSRIDPDTIVIEVADDGTVTISGQVPSYFARMAVRDDVLIVEGVRHIRDNLEVRYPSDLEIPSQEEIEENIRMIFDFNPYLNISDLAVSGEGGWIILDGFVDEYWKKYLAEDMAWNVTGVIGIENRIAIVPSRKLADETMAMEIEKALSRRPGLSSGMIEVTVQEGVVTLSGSVPDLRLAAAAYESALFAAGVKDIKNEIIVSG
jgi:osmotically-inducible protein OsmY